MSLMDTSLSGHPELSAFFTEKIMSKQKILMPPTPPTFDPSDNYKIFSDQIMLGYIMAYNLTLLLTRHYSRKSKNVYNAVEPR